MEKFVLLSKKFIETRDSDLIPSIYSGAVRWVQRRIYKQKIFAMSEFPDGFAEEVALNFIARLYDRMVTNEPDKVLMAIAANQVRSNVLLLEDIVNPKTYSSTIDEELLMKEFIEAQLEDLSETFKATVIYLLLYPSEFSKIFSLHKDSPIFYVSLVRLVDIKRRISKHFHGFTSESFSTQISKALLLSALYSIDPALVVLFLQMRDVTGFLQFCLLFEGKSIQIPTVTELQNVISKSVKFSKQMDNGKVLTDYDLSIFALEVDRKKFKEAEDFKFTPVLDVFFDRSLTNLFESYKNFHDRLIKSVDVCDPSDVRKVYKVMLQELTAQVALFRSITQSVGFVDSIRDLFALQEGG